MLVLKGRAMRWHFAEKVGMYDCIVGIVQNRHMYFGADSIEIQHHTPIRQQQSRQHQMVRNRWQKGYHNRTRQLNGT